MATSRKDYIATAKVIREQVEATAKYETAVPIRITLKCVAFDLASHFKASNSNFDRHKFMSACGFEPTEF